MIVGTPSTMRSVTVASVCTESGGLAGLSEHVGQRHGEARRMAAAINCSGLDPGRPRTAIEVYPPLIESPAVNVPLPVGRSPFHSAVPLAGVASSIRDG